MKLAILGGGQLGQMTALAAIPLGAQVAVLDPSQQAPCSCFSGFSVGDVTSADDVFAFGTSEKFDAVTYEWERVSVAGLKRLEAAGVPVFPSAEVLDLIHDKGTQKAWLVENGFPTAGFSLWKKGDAVPDFPCIQKARTGGYDGKGVQKVDAAAELWPVPSVMESLVEIETEIGVMVARGAAGGAQTYAPVEMVFDPAGNLVTSLITPAKITEDQSQTVQKIAKEIAEKLEYRGVLGVEFFIDKSGKVLVNELAPRPHNSGHHTTWGCNISQFEAHARAVLGLAIGRVEATYGASGMVNLIGQSAGKPLIEGRKWLLLQPWAHLQWYGKTACKPLRKMGHVTVVGPSRAVVAERIKRVEENVRVAAV